MGPQWLFSTADVQRARNTDNSHFPSDNYLSSILNLFASPVSPKSATEDTRPTKRRKANDGKAAHVRKDFDEDKSVVLARVQLDLHFPSSSTGDSVSPGVGDSYKTPIVVELDSFRRQDERTFSVSLSNRGTSAAVDIVAKTTDNHNVRPLEPHLKTAVSLGRTPMGIPGKSLRPTGKKRNRPYPGPAFCRCLLSPSPENRHAFRLVVEVRWLVGVSAVETLGSKSVYGCASLDVLHQYYPFSGEANLPWSLSDFYNSVHVPNIETIPRQIEHSLSETKLYPFQQRAVRWALEREGVAYPSGGGTLTDINDKSLPISFKPRRDAEGKETIYVSHHRGMIVKDPDTIPDGARNLRGGILAEEMGLGKTVELIALMCLHKRTVPAGVVYDHYTRTSIKPSGATLIISPPSLIEQWKSEIHTHAPELKVRHYQGMPSVNASKQAHNEATVEDLLQYDVVLTTYSVLSRDFHFAQPPPARFMRHAKKHEPRKSPLVEIQWWRVCLDEAQMVENGVSNAAKVARLIPRCNAWAVSGTPLRKDVEDLKGLLLFLRYEPLAGSKALWDHLDKATFAKIFNQIALRHTKSKVRNELRIPPQKRMVITVPFTAIEEQNYSGLFRQMCQECGLSEDGQPIGERDIDDPQVVEMMREFLVRLRLTCLHPHVGIKNRRALGAKKGPLRSLQEVLEAMIEQCDTAWKATTREYILTSLQMGHIVANDGSNQSRSVVALTEWYKPTLEFIQRHVARYRDELVEEEKRLENLGLENKDNEDEDMDSEDTQDESMLRISIIRKTLRSFLELEHACMFFIGTSHYQTKSNENVTKPDSDEFRQQEELETLFYDQAKAVRKEILRDPERKALAQMKKIKAKELGKVPSIPHLPDTGGIEFRKMLHMMDDIGYLLNEQAKAIWKYRQKVIDILLLPLVDEDEKGKEVTGDEYENSTKAQDELYVYIMALRTLVAQRSATVNGLQDSLTSHELDEARRQALHGEGHAPKLVLEVVDLCRKLKPVEHLGSLKGVVSGTRSLIGNLQWKAGARDARAAAELSIVQDQFSKITKVHDAEKKVVVELEKELEQFRATMNLRLEFYRQLQRISDQVRPWREELDPELDVREFASTQTKYEELQKRADEQAKKNKYLINLRDTDEQAVEHTCVICMDPIEIGILTVCGHKFCKDCILEWWNTRKTCPTCKRQIQRKDLTEMTLLKPEIQAHEETDESPSQTSSPSVHTSIYSDISSATMRQIKMIDLDGSYGTKIDMIARHLLWIRNNDPGAKSIIFSQFGDFLDVLRRALEQWQIGVSSIRDKNGIAKFKRDPALECFLLDAKSDSSGLNLTNATYVFLCEPLINPAIELQAIARVHRIGQQRPTSVFMYLVNDTVEEAIYEISVKRRLEHMGKDSNAASRSGTATPMMQEKTLDAANSLEMDAAPAKTLLRRRAEGEVVQADDLWQCLFGKPRKQQKAALTLEVDRHLRAEAAENRRDDAGEGSSGGAGGSNRSVGEEVVDERD